MFRIYMLPDQDVPANVRVKGEEQKRKWVIRIPGAWQLLNDVELEDYLASFNKIHVEYSSQMGDLLGRGNLIQGS